VADVAADGRAGTGADGAASKRTLLTRRQGGGAPTGRDEQRGDCQEPRTHTCLLQVSSSHLAPGKSGATLEPRSLEDLATP
jgi:hypothetical protein